MVCCCLAVNHLTYHDQLKNHCCKQYTLEKKKSLVHLVYEERNQDAPHYLLKKDFHDINSWSFSET